MGSDLGLLSLFNWNNTILFTHELLNEYTAQMSHSETPLAAFYSTVVAAYLGSGSPQPFTSIDTLRRAFYAFIELQQTATNIVCSVCGPHPTVTIFDGVSISFEGKHRTADLQPPTLPELDLEDDTVRPTRRITFIEDATIRNETKKAIKRTKEAFARRELPAVRYEAFESVNVRLLEAGTVESLALAAVLAAFPNLLQEAAQFGTSKMLENLLFIFVREVSAHESVLQLCPVPGIVLIESLVNGIEEPEEQIPSLRVYCPSIAALATYYLIEEGEDIPRELARLFLAVAVKAGIVMARLTGQHVEVLPGGLVQPQVGEYLKTGNLWAMEQLRRRPAYVNFAGEREDDAVEDYEKDAKSMCQKFYKSYTIAKQTGGIMVCWCPHIFSYGAHVIPSGEGRNDVFSPLWLYWPTAPKVIIYDFACALQSYCMYREPQFFKDTRFLIDEMHARDHTKCSTSGFLASYMGGDPLLRSINSSVAESGNAGLGRIRKAVSYCTQEHAAALIRHYLNIWNRRRATDLERLINNNPEALG